MRCTICTKNSRSLRSPTVTNAIDDYTLIEYNSIWWWSHHIICDHQIPFIPPFHPVSLFHSHSLSLSLFDRHLMRDLFCRRRTITQHTCNDTLLYNEEHGIGTDWDWIMMSIGLVPEFTTSRFIFSPARTQFLVDLLYTVSWRLAVGSSVSILFIGDMLTIIVQKDTIYSHALLLGQFGGEAWKVILLL